MRSETSIKERVAELENNFDSDRSDPEAQVVNSVRKARIESLKWVLEGNRDFVAPFSSGSKQAKRFDWMSADKKSTPDHIPYGSRIWQVTKIVLEASKPLTSADVASRSDGTHSRCSRRLTQKRATDALGNAYDYGLLARKRNTGRRYEYVPVANADSRLRSPPEEQAKSKPLITEW